MKRALLVIDYIHDFVDDDGALTVGKPAQDIRGNIGRALMKLGGSDLIVLANDCHNWDEPHPEKKLFPPHALAGTQGCQTVLEDVIKHAEAPVITIKKQRYSAFHRTGLVDMLRAAGVEKLYLAGVCTDISVLHSAVAAYNFGFDTVILEDCAASFNAQAHEFALAHFKNVLGFDIITSHDM